MALLFLLAGGLIPIGTFAAPIFAGICLMPIAMDIGTKWALLSWVAVSLLAGFLVPDIELVLFFALLLGYYPTLQPTLNKIKNKIGRWLAKLGLFNAVVAAVYSLLLFLFTSSALREELTGHGIGFWVVLLVMGNATFVLYDVLLDKVRLVYCLRLRKHFFRK
ncbi:hypothetical protein LJC04_04105 [Ruminococcaceae bacterium OttesenSCG-928-O06]|nr:hypothetical protein [Ruminococcaceae bacterium OttesenSCG-928-O06]